MSVIRQVFIKCDWCTATWPPLSRADKAPDTLRMARRLASYEGWYFGPLRRSTYEDVCPGHAREFGVRL